MGRDGRNFRFTASFMKSAAVFMRTRLNWTHGGNPGVCLSRIAPIPWNRIFPMVSTVVTNKVLRGL